MSKICTPVRKRFMIALPLSIAFGFVCVTFASATDAEIWWTPVMWMIVTNQFILGLTVALAGAYVRHPVFDFPFPAYLRGTALGIITSLPLATSAMIHPVIGFGSWMLFTAILAAGGTYGVLIDMIATQWGGEGKELLK